MTGINSDNRVTWVFHRFAGIYGAKWTTPLDDDAAYDAAFLEWGEALAGLTEEQVRRGVMLAKSSFDDWPPSVPGFLRLALGMPAPFVAVSNACRMERDALSIEIRRRAGGAHAIRTASERDSRRMCEHAYRDVLEDINERVLTGHRVDPAALLEEFRDAEAKAVQQKSREPVSIAGVIPSHLGGLIHADD